MTAYSFPPLPTPKIWCFVVTEPSGPTPGTPLRRSFTAAPRLFPNPQGRFRVLQDESFGKHMDKAHGRSARTCPLPVPHMETSKQEFGMLGSTLRLLDAHTSLSQPDLRKRQMFGRNSFSIPNTELQTQVHPARWVNIPRLAKITSDRDTASQVCLENGSSRLQRAELRPTLEAQPDPPGPATVLGTSSIPNLPARLPHSAKSREGGWSGPECPSTFPSQSNQVLQIADLSRKGSFLVCSAPLLSLASAAY